ncbi:MAG: diaminobutyrate--2-oxoglutarate transaminase [Clostridia bacterium]|nr:diaminobutyrate--2-oxoglutarate transaminase [Clostridia bacterium]
MNIFEQYESNVRSYCRKFTAVFDRAKGSELFSVDGKRYIDFFAGAGAMNYGHNNPYIKKALLEFFESDKVVHALDMHTAEKARFIELFEDKILKPRELEYKIMCCGPTGANGVEAALKLARKNTGRVNVIAFSGAFHGMSLGALSCTSGLESREGASLPLNNVTFMPYPVGSGADFDTLKYLEAVLSDDHSGIDKPAAIICETTQAEGGINTAPTEWLIGLEALCRRHGIVLIVDDIQVGCGRTGSFFSFERAGIKPDMVILSKSIGGYGLPMSLLLINPALDIFAPAEHNGTFRGFQAAFTAAAAAIEFRESYDFDGETVRKGKLVADFIEKSILPLDSRLSMRGIGLVWGIDCSAIPELDTVSVVKEAFANGLILELAGRKDCVLKIMPPLVIEDELLLEGLEILKKAIEKKLKK